MKTKEIEAAAIEGIDPDNLKWEGEMWGEYKHRVNDFKAGARWALERVREWADREYDKRGDRPESEGNDGERYALAGCCKFATIED